MKLHPHDLRIDIFRNAVVGSTSYCRIIHLPTGYSASCDNECKTHGNNERIFDSERKKCAVSKLTALLEG